MITNLLMTGWRYYRYATLLLLIAVLGSANAYAKEGAIPLSSMQSLNDQWQFVLQDTADEGDWQDVDLPHSWNALDAFDEVPGYYRGIGWYQKKLALLPQPNQRYYLKFEGVNQVAEVYLNNQRVGQHQGGYTAFVIDITEQLRSSGDNLLRVKVDNSHNDDLVPLKGDFNFYGGIYRDVWLISKNRVHFDFGDYASSGIFVRYPQVTEQSASIKVESHISGVDQQNLTLHHRLYSADNQLVAESSATAKSSQVISLPKVKKPALWSPDSPVLYRLQSDILDSDGRLLDQQTTTVGLRYFSFDAKQGLILNGQPVKLMGVNRHQDFAGQANAVSDQRAVADIGLIKASGSNFLRTAHYPQDQSVLDAADKMGLVVTMEIPLDHDITDSQAFYANALHMQKEMIYQYFNHPSIFVWAYMNEMLLGRNWERDRQKIDKITAFAKVMEKVTRETDPSRYTMIPNHGQFELYQQAGLLDIPMLVGWNLYFGWYEEDIQGLGKFLDHYHSEYPDKPVLITEYGAGSDPRMRSFKPRRFDFTVDWQNQFMQANISQIMQRDFVAGAAVWNMFDFGSANRRDAVPTINSKGLMTIDRQAKDSYWLLQSWLSKQPMIHIADSAVNHRAGKDNGEGVSNQRVEVYGNTASAQLFINGTALPEQTLTGHIAQWQVPFKQGVNQLRVVGINDQIVSEDNHRVTFTLYPERPDGSRFTDIYINVGGEFYFDDLVNGILWLPDEAYQDGFYGVTGGEPYFSRNLGVGTDADIIGTNNDPLFQTQRRGQYQYYFDAPPGQYELIILYSNLNKQQQVSSKLQLAINGRTVSLQTPEQAFTALQKKWRFTNVQNQIRLDVQGDNNNGINGIGLRRID
ncbi:glycoside hydrolase family 2 TIM barrel-domain containing protein [Neptunicella sp. SCSIO 80796]|uniref:glycoside hydrolase family 2 TIM barrel-domain containing protein n=1 Tax=Neptunicella plasticusilytica TaxID=3117012 RepID=UPI003A4D7B05